MKAVVTVIGKDKKGIIAKVSNLIADIGGNIEDISQTVMRDYFAMIMLVDMSTADINIAETSQMLDKAGKNIGVSIRIQNEEIFNAMSKI